MYRPFLKPVVYDGVDLSCYFDINDLTISPFPDITANALKVPGKTGLHFLGKEIGERTVTMNLSVKVSDRNPAHTYQEWRDLMGFIFKDTPRPLLVDEGKTLYVIATDSSDIERLGYRGESEITFTAYDPFFYGKEHEVPIKSGTTSFYIRGAVEVWPTLEVSGVTSTLTVTNVLTDEKIVIPSGITSSTKIVIDNEKTRCTANGSYIAVDLSQTDYFSLPPGEAQIKLSGGTGTLRYRERYL